MAVRLSALRIAALYLSLPGRFLVLILVGGQVNTKAMKGWNNSMN
jgi:hypothetical protein